MGAADEIDVPAAAKAGQLRLEPCSVSTEAGNRAADCGTLVVPENRANLRSRLIALPVTGIRARANPDRWLFAPIKESNVRIASFYGLMESGPKAAPLTAPATFEAWQAAADGDASGFWAMSLLADLTFPEAFVWGDIASIGRVDDDAAARHSSFPGGDESLLGDAASRVLWADGRLVDAWPDGPDDDIYDRIRASDVETLLVGGTLDGSTPLGAGADELLRKLPNGKQVVLEDFGHTVDFWNVQPEGGTRLITTLLATGAVDESGYEDRVVDF